MNNYGRIARPADRLGAYGLAWLVPMPPPGQRARPEHDGTVVMWLLNVPDAHPFWSYWTLAVVHLRPIAGVRPAAITQAGATHELLIASLNPETPLPDLRWAGAELQFDILQPLDVVQQFAVNDDIQAAQLADLAVAACVDGLASPDQDWRAWWRNAIAHTAQHLRDGLHPEGRA